MSISRTRITPIIIAVFVFTIGTFISVANTTNATTGDVVASYNFEDGRVPQPGSYAYYANKVAPAVLTDPDGNHFLRMTGSPEDTGNTFHTTPPTIREELLIGETDWSASDSQVVTYCFSMRSPSFNPPQSSTLAQVFFNSGPVTSGTWSVGMYEDPGARGIEVRDGGNIPLASQYDRWDNFSFTVNFAVSNGTVDVYQNGQHLGRLTGRTVLGADVPHSAYFFLNIYGGPGTVDFDNIRIVKGGSSSQTPAPQPTPPSSSCRFQ